jgi:hypothetical protein
MFAYGVFEAQCFDDPPGTGRKAGQPGTVNRTHLDLLTMYMKDGNTEQCNNEYP